MATTSLRASTSKHGYQEPTAVARGPRTTRIAAMRVAFQEAQMIEKHYLEATKGKTYAELEREDPIGETAMTASFLRASLFTSVVSFGIAAMALGVGIVMVIAGYGLLALTRSSHASATG